MTSYVHGVTAPYGLISCCPPLKVPPLLRQRVHQARAEHRLRRRLPVPRRLRRAQLPAPRTATALRAAAALCVRPDGVPLRGLRSLDPGVDAVRRGRAVPRPLRRGRVRRQTEQRSRARELTAEQEADRSRT